MLKNVYNNQEPIHKSNQYYPSIRYKIFLKNMKHPQKI